MLASIGKGRDDEFEVTHAGADIGLLDPNRVPCLSERATFMSPDGYTVLKSHPYRENSALRGTLHDTAVSVPGYAFESVPFRWLSRALLTEDIGHERVPSFDPRAEAAVDSALNWSPGWVMDGANQRAVIEAFFESVMPGESLVFAYLKHSPLQDERMDRLLVGAARITRMTPPPMWNQTGERPFDSSMWETIVEHSLRPDMQDGILLPYQGLVELADQGIDIDRALAWAPEGRDVEFSYVTEHLSDDAAIEALGSLSTAATAMRELGLVVPDAGLEWLQAQTERLWQLRGPVPGLPGVLRVIGVQHPYAAARAVLSELDEDDDPWDYLDRIFTDPAGIPDTITRHIGRPQSRVWAKTSAERRAVLQLLSGFDISPAQVAMLLEGETEVEMEPEDLLDNPYYAATCTYGIPDHVPFSTVDRALFPPTYITWQPSIPAETSLTDYIDRRRIEALLTDIIERRAIQGDTVVPIGEAVALALAEPLAQPPTLNSTVLAGLDLDHDGIQDWEEWSPLTSVLLAHDIPAYKLGRLADTAELIRQWVTGQRKRQRFGLDPRRPHGAGPGTRAQHACQGRTR